MYELELFAGAGGGILGKNLLGFTTIGAVEILPFCRRVQLERQRDDCCPMYPIWDDIRTFRQDNPECADYIEWVRGIAGELVVSGGFPCQDISSCGLGRGISGAKSGLWREMARVVGEIRPRFVFVENSPLLARRGLEVVLADLAAMGYDARWCVLGAGHLGYPIKRDRLWLLGEHRAFYGQGHEPALQQSFDHRHALWNSPELAALQAADVDRLLADGLLGRTPDGVADWLDRVEALGNGQVPAVAALAWSVLTNAIK